jgi:hypothetical protein
MDVATILRAVGALALLAMGVIHLQQYLGADYSAIPTIGTLFLLNFAGALVLAIALLGPIERIAGRRGASLVAAAGAGMAATSIAFLLISEHTTLFGFREAGYGPAIVLAIAVEAVAVVALVAFLAVRLSAER